MSKTSQNPLSALRDIRARCLAIAIAGAFQMTPLYAATVNVTSCGDAVGDTGTLRSKIVTASNNDIINLSSLVCTDSLITLAQGAIPVSVNNLTIEASAANHVNISGNLTDRVFRHTGSGTLSIDNMTIEQGKYVTPKFAHAFVSGGCIYSTGGSVALTDSTITACSIVNNTQRSGTVSGDGANGGGIGAPEGSVTLTRSTVSNNFVQGIDPAYSTSGGGVRAHVLIAVDSIISGNIVIPGSEGTSEGGGATIETAIVTNSAIFNNSSDFGAGLYIEGGTSASTITNSTISGNEANYHGGGITSRNPITLSNTTIAFNKSPVAGGLYQSDSPAIMQSSILADNSDLDGNRADLRLSSATLSGSNNLITDTTDTLPTGTITSDPRLAPLALHGGTTPVHPLLAGSPALNVGSNPNGLTLDQRGTGYPRTFGPGTDIGAYESQGIHDDELFYDGFDDLP